MDASFVAPWCSKPKHACNEEAHRQLICCYLAQGQRHLALRQFLMCLTALKEELNLSPSPETQALYQRIIA